MDRLSERKDIKIEIVLKWDIGEAACRRDIPEKESSGNGYTTRGVPFGGTNNPPSLSVLEGLYRRHEPGKIDLRVKARVGGCFFWWV